MLGIFIEIFLCRKRKEIGMIGFLVVEKGKEVLCMLKDKWYILSGKGLKDLG